MSVTVENNQYVVIIPEESIRQEFNPDTRQPFSSEAEAQSWQDEYMASIVAHQAALTTAKAAAVAAALSAQINLIVTADKIEAAVGATFTITSTLKDGHGAVVPSNDTFAVPIQDDTGAIVKVKSVTLVSGTATVTISFDKSGYYRITEECMNRKLTTMHINLPTPLELTVFE